MYNDVVIIGDGQKMFRDRSYAPPLPGFIYFRKQI